MLRLAQGRPAAPAAAICDSRTLQSTPASGTRAGYDGVKVHMAVDTLSPLLAFHVTAASEQDQSQVMRAAAKVQEVTGDEVEVAFMD